MQRQPLHVDDPENPESRAGTKLVIDTLAAPDTGAIARAKTAIALHLASDGRAAPLASYRPSTVGANARGRELPAGRGSLKLHISVRKARGTMQPATYVVGLVDEAWGRGTLTETDDVAQIPGPPR